MKTQSIQNPPRQTPSSKINTTSTHTFTAANWNACGVKSKLPELAHFISEHDLDIILISETHLKPNINFSVPNYNTFRTDRLHHRNGGTAVLVKRSLQACLVHEDRSNGYEATTVKLKLPKLGKINFTAIYNPPDNLLTEEDLNRLFPTNVRTVVAGDLNSKNIAWGCRKNNPNGKTHKKYSDKNGINILPQQ